MNALQEYRGHTPGPWDFYLNPMWVPWPEAIGIFCRKSGECIAWLTSNAGHRDRDEANARLIAAAPDMLEALQAMLSAENGDEMEMADAMCQAAVAKAVGDRESDASSKPVA